MATSIAPSIPSTIITHLVPRSQSAARAMMRPVSRQSALPSPNNTTLSLSAPVAPQVQPQIALQIRRSVALLAPNMRGSLKQAGRVVIVSAEDTGIGHGVAVLYAADGSGVSVVRLPR